MAQPPSLKDISLDGIDMFLLSLIDDEISLAQAAEIAPRHAVECVRRVLRLGQLGVVELSFESADERLLAQSCDGVAAQDLLDNARTLRPPPRSSQPRVLGGDDTETITGIRRRPTPPELAPVKRRGA